MKGISCGGAGGPLGLAGPGGGAKYFEGYHLCPVNGTLIRPLRGFSGAGCVQEPLILALAWDIRRELEACT